MKHSIKFVILTVISMVVGVAAYAQVTTSSLGGRVVDEKGIPAVGVAVVATHTPSGTVYGAMTNNDGRYTLNGMRSGGPYTVELSSLGYQTIRYTDVTLQLGELFSLNATIKESSESLSESVVIASANSRFSTERTGASTNINNNQIVNLPTVNRSIGDVTRLSAYGGNGMSIAGADGRTSNFTVDGANFNNNFGLSDGLPGGGNPISLDAIEEVQVVVSPFDVRQTGFIGGGVNAITKSGTNTFKGSAYVYHRNENMRGDTVDGTVLAGARDKDRFTTYGVTFGGPIIKNKLFFFVNYEQSVIPTVVNRWRGSVDGVGNEAAFISRTTVDDLKKVSDFVKEKYGYDTGSYTNFPADETNRKILARLDWNITDKHHLALRYNYTLNRYWQAPNKSSSDAAVRATKARMSQYSMSFANSMYSMDNLATTWSLDLNSHINDRISNQLLATYSKLDDARGSTSSEFPFIDILDGTGTVTPYMSLGYELFTWNNGVHNTIANIKDDLTLYFANHKATVGLSYEYQMADNAYMRNGTGYYRYNSLDDFLNGAAPETVNFTYGYDNLNPDNPAVRVRYNKVSAYLQDEWNVTEAFKLTAGLRFDTFIFNNKDLMTNQAIKDIDYNGTHFDTGKWPNTHVSVSPRLGFSWDVLGDKSLKLRGGTGLFTGRLPLVFFTNMATNSGMMQYNGKIQTDKNGIPNPHLEAFRGDLITSISAMKKKWTELGYPTTIKPEDGVVPSTFAAVDPNFKMPQVWKTSLAVDYSFPTSFPFSITAEGIFNKSVNDVCITDKSIKPIDGFARFNGPDNRPIYPADPKIGTYEDGGKLKSVPNAFVLTNTSKGYGWIGSVTVNMRPVDGISLMAAYTHTASYELTGMPGSDASSAFTYVPGYEGPNHVRLHASQYVTPDRLVASATIHDKSNNHFSFIYEGWRGGANYSYALTNDMNSDGYEYDVLYVPANADEMKVIDVDPVVNGQSVIWFSNEESRDRFWNYVENNKYLSSRKGKYTEAYSVYSPWVNRLDFRYTHDFKVKAGKTTNTLQLSVDIKNILNLFNSSWGVSKYMNADFSDNGVGRILTYDGVAADGAPVFSTPSAIKPGVDTWVYSYTLGQCWSAQIGIKYMFN